MYAEISRGFLSAGVCVGGVGTGVALPYAAVAGDSDTFPLLDSGLESEGLSVRGGDVRPCIKGDDDVVGGAAK